MKSKKSKIKKANEMLAIFIGAKMFIQNKKVYWVFNGFNVKKNTEDIIKTRKLKFHKSWDWLIPVCEKIRDTYSAEISKGISFTAGHFEDLQRALSVYHLEKVFHLAVEIIKYKNDPKNK